MLQSSLISLYQKIHSSSHQIKMQDAFLTGSLVPASILLPTGAVAVAAGASLHVAPTRPRRPAKIDERTSYRPTARQPSDGTIPWKLTAS